MKGKSRYSQRKEIKESLFHKYILKYIYLSIGNSLNRRETIKERTLEYNEGKKKNHGEANISKHNRLSSLLEFYIACLVMETKTVTVSDVVINVKDNYKLERIKCP